MGNSSSSQIALNSEPSSPQDTVAGSDQRPLGQTPAGEPVSTVQHPGERSDNRPRRATRTSLGSLQDLRGRLMRGRTMTIGSARFVAPPPYTAEPAAIPAQSSGSSSTPSVPSGPTQLPPGWPATGQARDATLASGSAVSAPGPSPRVPQLTVNVSADRIETPPVDTNPFRRLQNASVNSARDVGGVRFSSTPGSGSSTPYVQSPVSPQAPMLVPSAPGSRQRAPVRRATREDPLDMLKRYKTVIVVDDSSSMEGELWIEAREALAALVQRAQQYTDDGIDVHFLNDEKVGLNMQSASAIERLFDSVRPMGITPTGEKLEDLLLAYMLKLERWKEIQFIDNDIKKEEVIKPINYIVITDGAPTDDPESVIVSVARRLDAGNWPLTQVGIQFFQIGDDPEAAEALQQLDDNLSTKHQIRDIVDTTPYSGQVTAELIAKALLGGINKRMDRKQM
ncbi:hypothetical protein SISSUDRAFT_1040804 [Sistotremastrum suecicum HHB10207 ss-3]|uniref:VWFA domain-containing protein n=1 Tax=Sistotremastrum suecicum HHB10207 ss-3 TaxID=1314776 RepID=A0A166HPF9_9AGAM|nr:hypothetical protein SISSUDRAFT_1040804 [Sistotremastrum suecicum HHB10207 ss-3]